MNSFIACGLCDTPMQCAALKQCIRNPPPPAEPGEWQPAAYFRAELFGNTSVHVTIRDDGSMELQSGQFPPIVLTLHQRRMLQKISEMF